jgi:hypothetical protein
LERDELEDYEPIAQVELAHEIELADYPVCD